MKIIVALLLFVHGFGIAQSKSEYDLKISHQTEIKYSRFDLVVHETLTIKVNLIFELITEFVEVIQQQQLQNQHPNRFKRDVVYERMPHSFPTVDDAVENFRRDLI